MRTPGPRRARTSADTSSDTPTSLVADSMRLATLTTSPMAVNCRRCDIPSAQLRPGDRVGVGARESLRKAVKDSLEQRSSYPMPAWLERDGGALEGRVTAVPARADVSFDVREQLIVELMSK